MQHLTSALAASLEASRHERSCCHCHHYHCQSAIRKPDIANIARLSRSNSLRTDTGRPLSLSRRDIHHCDDMCPSFLRCCLDERFRKRSRKQSRDLDERFGDMAISGPMMGGWNQTSSATRSLSPPRLGTVGLASDQLRSKVPRSHSSTRNRNSSSSSSSTSRRGTPTMNTVKGDQTSSSDPNKPGFVYKPASEEYFKNMSELGRSPEPGYLRVDSHAKHQRNLSFRSEASLESSPAMIPCHPSYHPEPLLSSGTASPASVQRSLRQSRSPTYPLDQCVDRRKYYPSPDLSEPDSTQSGADSRQGTPRFSFMPQSRSKKNTKTKTRRNVTDEMVPSTNELFG